MKVAIYNDTGHRPHFGCKLVMDAYRELLAVRDIELIGNPDKADLVLVNGEGCIHHDQSIDLLALAKTYPCILMNCVFQDISPAHSHLLQNFKHITVRESMSAEYMESHGYTPEIVPDLIFSHTLPQFRGKRKKSIFFSDREPDASISTGFYTQSPDEPQFIEKMSAYERACCGRFHAICVAAMLNMPFSAWSSNTWKNEAIMADMGIPDLYADSQRAALIRIPDECSDSVARYVTEAKIKINALFDRISEL